MLSKAEVRLVLREREGIYGEKSITTIDDAVRLLQENMQELDRENIWIINFDQKMNPLNYHVVSVGDIGCSIASPANIFKTAILQNAAFIMMAHNHPSGDPTPSGEDIETTKRIKEAGDILGIGLVDHVIIGNGDYYSFKESSSML